MRQRLVIIGGPHVGKTTLSERLSVEHGVTNVRHSDDVKHLGWSESSAEASKWFDEQGDWVIEGVQMARALRKWLAANPDETLDADIIILDQVFGDPLLPGQEAMRKGVHTVFRQIEPELIRRGARVHGLNHPDDAISLFEVRKANPEESGSDRRQKSMLKSTYKTLDEIPEGDRQHYKKIGDRYVLELDGEHPVQAQNSTLAQEKKDEVKAANQRAATAEAETQRLRAAAENQPTLPSGHVAVPADEAKLLDSVKELGEGADTKARVENVKTKLTEHVTLKTENETLKKTEMLRRVADSGIAGKKLKVSVLETLDKNAGGLTYEERDVSATKDGKTTTEKAWHVKDGNKWVLLSEYSDTHWKDFGPVLMADAPSQPTGTRVPGQLPSNQGGGAPNVYSRIRQEAEERQKKVETNSVPLEKRLGQAV
jgi:hypothetical protein